MFSSARGQDQSVFACPPTAKSCKVLIVTPDEERSLAGPDMLFDHAVWANRVKFDALVQLWRDKLRDAPQGRAIPSPEPLDKK